MIFDTKKPLRLRSEWLSFGDTPPQYFATIEGNQIKIRIGNLLVV
jgi:hypothetical protein